MLSNFIIRKNTYYKNINFHDENKLKKQNVIFKIRKILNMILQIQKRLL